MFGDFKPLVSNSKFRYLWTSQILSQLTIYVMNFLLLITIFNQTGSSLSTASLWVVYAIPSLLIGPIAAAYVDMTNRKKLLVISNLMQFFVIFIFSYIHNYNYYSFYFVALIYSFVNQFYVPAEFAVLPSLVKKKNYPLANGLFFLTQQAAVIVGFSIASVLLGKYGFTNSLYICSGFMFLAFLSVLRLPSLTVNDNVPNDLTKAIGKFFKRIVEGYKFIKSKPRVWVPFLLLIGVQIIAAITVVTAPALATDIVGIPPESAGILIAAPAGLGAIIGSLIFSKLLANRWRKVTTVEFSMILVVIFSLSLAYVVPNVKDELVIAFAIVTMVIAGMSFVGTLIPLQTFLQEEVPGGLRGRVFGNFWFLVTIVTILPVILSGLITDILGVDVIYKSIAGIAIICVVYIKRHSNQFISRNF